MKILEYDMVDPISVLHLNLMSLSYTLTPDRVDLIRRFDARPFPFFGIYAVEDGVVAGQILVYRLPMMTIDGPEDVGGICAVCTHPGYCRRGVAARLMDETHDRMRSSGLRFSTLGTVRHRVAHLLYQRLGYEDVVGTVSIFATRKEVLTADADLRAERAGEERLSLADSLFRHIANDYLGFAHRHEPFMSAMATIGELDLSSVWLLWDGVTPIGYAIASVAQSVLIVSDLLVDRSIKPSQVLASLVRQTDADYVQITTDYPSRLESLLNVGYRFAYPHWSTFMMKSLLTDVTVQDAYRLFGFGTERFLRSWLDTT